MSLRGPQGGPGYDFVTALTNLRDKIQELSAVQQQYQGQQTQLSSGLRFWRHNKSNIFFIFTMYAMSTASVVSAMMAESRLQVSACNSSFPAAAAAAVPAQQLTGQSWPAPSAMYLHI